MYFANVASVLDERSVYVARSAFGRAMAQIETEDITPDHLVVPVPDTFKAAGDAFAYELGIPAIEGFWCAIATSDVPSSNMYTAGQNRREATACCIS